MRADRRDAGKINGRRDIVLVDLGKIVHRHIEIDVHGGGQRIFFRRKRKFALVERAQARQFYRNIIDHLGSCRIGLGHDHSPKHDGKGE